jgi:magnesium transporter
MEKENKHKWPPESAGALMTRKVPTVGKELSLAEVKDYLVSRIYEFDSINYIYVLDEVGNLFSVFSIKELFRIPAEERVKMVCRREKIYSVDPRDDREKAANLALEQNIKAIPVVDKKGKFLGAIQNDTITDIMYEELREDMLRSSGILSSSRPEFDDVLKMPFLSGIKHRLPWLVIGLFGGMGVAKIIGFFESVLTRNLVLAAFIPLVVYIADAARTQLEAFAVRDLALAQKLNVFRYLLRQSLTVLVLAVIVGWLAAAASLMFGYGLAVSIVLGVAIVTASLTSILTGVVVPFIFRKLDVDPANASGPIGTIIQDIMSVSVYFLIATWLL